MNPRPRLVRLSPLFLASLLAVVSAPLPAQDGFGQPPVPQQPPPGHGPGMAPPGGGLAPPPGGGFAPPPAGGFQPGGAPGGFDPGAGTAGGQAGALQALLQAELRDYGVAATGELQSQMHGPTPTSLPGGQVITTDRLLALYQQRGQNLLVFHVLGPGPMLPNAQPAAPASQPGGFDDALQQQFSDFLRQATGGDSATPMVFYCLNTQCWMSYNAALRAVRAGYRQVHWYRGGIEAWQQAQQLAGGAGQAPSTPAAGWR